MCAAESQPVATGRDGKHGHGAAIAAGIVALLFAVALLIVPGFMAAGFSRSDPDFVCGFWDVKYWDEIELFQWRDENFRTRMEYALITPSGWVMRHSRALRSFYIWQFRVAGGRTFVD
jgi:hypothetical protein